MELLWVRALRSDLVRVDSAHADNRPAGLLIILFVV